MFELGLTITKEGYIFTGTDSEQYTIPLGKYLIDFTDVDFNYLYQEIDRLLDLLSFINRDTDEASNEVYYYLGNKLIDTIDNPFLVWLVINDLDRIERPYFLAGSGYDNDELIASLDNQKNLMQQFQDLVSIMLSSNISQWPDDLYSLYNNLVLSQNIKAYYQLTKSGFSQLNTVSDTISMITLDLYQVKANNIIISKCHNCGKFFIPSVRSDEKYCNRIFKDGKTCKDIGYLRNMDQFQSIYRSAYKTQKARVRYNKDAQPNYEEQHFKPWNSAAMAARDAFKDKNDIEGFKKWLKEHKNSY